MLTLRQIEVIRAVMVAGTINGAAKLLNVSAPGISRLMKYTEKSLGFRLFDRRHGRYVPALEANDVFNQINAVYKKVEDLQFTVKRLESGHGSELKIASVPSIANMMVPRAIERIVAKHPGLVIDVDILKLEEAMDYLLLEKGEMVAMSYKVDHPSLDFIKLAQGKLLCITPQDHPLAGSKSVSAADIARYPLIGIDPKDPYGRIMADIFERRGLTYTMPIRARFGTTVCRLVQAGLGIAVIDQFTVAHNAVPGICLLDIDEPTAFQAYVAVKAERGLSSFAESFITLLRAEMTAVVASGN
jgi:DNA-binding transcriptional LysR family regulator